MGWKAVAAAGVASAAALSLSLPAAAADEEKVFNGIVYACAGVGLGSQDDPRWPGYPAKLVFAGGDGAYLSNVAVTIETGEGETLFEMVCDGPWLLVDLPPGKYRVAAVARNAYREEFTLTVGGDKQVEHVVRFAELR
jgi:hypothetical protein